MRSLWTKTGETWIRQAECAQCGVTYTVERATPVRRIPTRCVHCVRARGSERSRRHRNKANPPACVDCGATPEYGPSGRRCRRCADCEKVARLAAQYAWRETHPEQWAVVQARYTERRRTEPALRARKHAGMVFRIYGISPEKLAELEGTQGGRCAICRQLPSGEPNGRRGKGSGLPRSARLHVDHDHACCPGKESCGQCVRGLLCGNCNTMIGLAGENPAVLASAIEYLKRE